MRHGEHRKACPGAHTAVAPVEGVARKRFGSMSRGSKYSRLIARMTSSSRSARTSAIMPPPSPAPLICAPKAPAERTVQVHDVHHVIVTRRKDKHHLAVGSHRVDVSAPVIDVHPQDVQPAGGPRDAHRTLRTEFLDEPPERPLIHRQAFSCQRAFTAVRPCQSLSQSRPAPIKSFHPFPGVEHCWKPPPFRADCSRATGQEPQSMADAGRRRAKQGRQTTGKGVSLNRHFFLQTRFPFAIYIALASPRAGNRGRSICQRRGGALSWTFGF